VKLDNAVAAFAYDVQYSGLVGVFKKNNTEQIEQVKQVEVTRIFHSVLFFSKFLIKPWQIEEVFDRWPPTSAPSPWD